MQTEIQYGPSYSLARVTLAPSETLRVEGGAMVAMHGVTMETKAEGGLLKSLTRTLAGESFFINTYQAGDGGGELLLAPALPGDLRVLELSNETLMVQSGSFVAAAPTVELDTKWGGAKTFFAGEGLILLRATGSGPLIVSSYGAIHEMTLQAGQTFTVDTGHVVAFTEDVGFKVRSVGGVKSTLFSGEGLVVDLTGPGRLLIQTRSEASFLAWLVPKLPKKD
jgi:uncharacterized protein (TIGR00266 family)